MKSVVVLYSACGSSPRAAEHIAETLNFCQLRTDVLDVSATGADYDLSVYDAAVVVSSCDGAEHALVCFLFTHRSALERIPTALLTTGELPFGGAAPDTEPPAAGSAAKPPAVATPAWLSVTGWRPGLVFGVEGAHMYLQYNPLVRWVVCQLAAPDDPVAASHSTRGRRLTRRSGRSAMRQHAPRVDRARRLAAA